MTHLITTPLTKISYPTYGRYTKTNASDTVILSLPFTPDMVHYTALVVTPGAVQCTVSGVKDNDSATVLSSLQHPNLTPPSLSHVSFPFTC